MICKFLKIQCDILLFGCLKFITFTWKGSRLATCEIAGQETQNDGCYNVQRITKQLKHGINKKYEFFFSFMRQSFFFLL